MAEGKKSGYAGSVSNAGAQVVKAPHKQPKTPQNIKKMTGKDLRGRAGSK